MKWPRIKTKALGIVLCAVFARLALGSSSSIDANSVEEEQSTISRFEALIKEGKYSEVCSQLESFTAHHPHSWRALYQIGYVDFRLHHIRKSLFSLSKSLALNDGFADAHKILAFDLNILGRQDLAIVELNAATRLDPASAESFYELGRIYYERGSYLQAVEKLERAKTLDPASVRVYHNLGLAYSAIGQNAKAIPNFEEGIRLNAKQPKPSPWPLIDYGTYHNLQGEFQRAKDDLLQAIAIDCSWDQEYDELSKAYRGLGQRKAAIDCLKHAIAINPTKAEYHYVLARLYTQTQQPEKARQELVDYEEYHRQNGVAKTSIAPQ